MSVCLNRCVNPVTVGTLVLTMTSLVVARSVVSPESASPEPQATQPAGQPISVHRTLMNEYAGLGLMNDTIGSTLPQASQRQTLLTGYIKSKGLDSEYASFKAPQFNPGATFHQALNAAINEASIQAPMTEDVDTLTREVGAQTVLVQGVWDELQSTRKQVWALTSFVRSKNLFDDYHAWAVKTSADMAAKAKADDAAQQAKATAQERARMAQRDAAQHALQASWDKLPYSTGIDYNYHFSQNAPSASTGGPQGNGSYNGDNYWNGSYYNGYADSYYDIWGAPAAVGVGGWNSYWRGYGRGTGAFHPSAGATIGAPRAAGGFRR